MKETAFGLQTPGRVTGQLIKTSLAWTVSECYSLVDASQQGNKHAFDARQRQDSMHLSVSVADTSLART